MLNTSKKNSISQLTQREQFYQRLPLTKPCLKTIRMRQTTGASQSIPSALIKVLENLWQETFPKNHKPQNATEGCLLPQIVQKW